jgi:hypothetical protein
LLSRGTHPKYVQQLLGHASMQLTLDRYSHWMPSMGKHTASAMDDALEDSDDAPENEKEATWSVERPPVGVLLVYWTTKESPGANPGLSLFLRFAGISSEPTSGLEPLTCSLRVIIHVLQGFTRVCKSRISKPVSP